MSQTNVQNSNKINLKLQITNDDNSNYTYNRITSIGLTVVIITDIIKRTSKVTSR